MNKKIYIYKSYFCYFDRCHTGSRSASTEEMLETENNRMVDELAAKVSRLKGVMHLSMFTSREGGGSGYQRAFPWVGF